MPDKPSMTQASPIALSTLLEFVVSTLKATERILYMSRCRYFISDGRYQLLGTSLVRDDMIFISFLAKAPETIFLTFLVVGSVFTCLTSRLASL